jgi:hypothetical protein
VGGERLAVLLNALVGVVVSVVIGDASVMVVTAVSTCAFSSANTVTCAGSGSAMLVAPAVSATAPSCFRSSTPSIVLRSGPRMSSRLNSTWQAGSVSGPRARIHDWVSGGWKVWTLNRSRRRESYTTRLCSAHASV